MIDCEEQLHIRRDLATLAFSRIALAGILLGYYLYFPSKEEVDRSSAILGMANLYMLICTAFYFVSRYSLKGLQSQIVAQVAIDFVFIAALTINANQIGQSTAILFFLPLVGAALFLPRVYVLAASSLATIFVLLIFLMESLQVADYSSFGVAGTYGCAFLVIPLILSKLTERLRQQQVMTVESNRKLVSQISINSFVTENMSVGFLVLDNKRQIHCINTSASMMLGVGVDLGGDAPLLTSYGHLADLITSFDELVTQLTDGATQESRRIVEVDRSLPESVNVKNRNVLRVEIEVTTLAGRDGSPPLFVVFLTDLSVIEDRAQQLKLASMGRLTASIAHEIRNPLAAISHANEILIEDCTDGSSKRLLEIVSVNVHRVNKMVEDILALSRKKNGSDSTCIMLDIVTAVVDELAKSKNIPLDVFRVEVQPMIVKFDSENLRNVLLNLVENATRFCSMEKGSIEISSVLGSSGTVLRVIDDGELLCADARAHLFEPFYSTHAKGTGLGLFLAREFCLSNGARLEYKSAPSLVRRDFHCNGFAITFAGQERVDPL